MKEEKITGVRVYVLTVDSETNTVLKCEEEDPNTRARTQLNPNFKVVPAQYPAPQAAIPAGFVPSIVILVGGQPAVGPTSTISTQMRDAHPPTVTPPPPQAVPPSQPSKKAAEDKKADQGRPPKV